MIAECMGKLSDAVALAGHTNHDLSLKRQDMHKFCLPRESAGICANHVPMTEEWLYPSGADFHRSLKEARDALKLSQQKGKGGHGQQWSGNNGTFLGQE